MHVPRMSRVDIEYDLNASLQNLRTDVIDVYWLHRDDLSTPVEEIIETMNAQVRADDSGASVTEGVELHPPGLVLRNDFAEPRDSSREVICQTRE